MFILEGNNGSGKSTLIKYLNQNLAGVLCKQEPVEAWQKTGIGGSLLKEFYDNPKRWAYSMESYTLLCRVREQEGHKFGKVLVERSVFSGFYCFAKNGFQSGFMTKIEWEIYKKWFDFFAQKFLQIPLGFVYLKSDPEICYKRVRKRSRAEEESMSLKYLKDLDALYDQLLLKKLDVIDQLKNVPILVLDGNLDFENNETILKGFAQQIKEFIDLNYIASVQSKRAELSI